MKGMKDSVQVSTPNLHELDITHTTPTTFDFYQFRPVMIQEMYPKDTIKVNVSDYFTGEPLAGKVYGRFFKKYAAFFVPDRILWDKYNDYITGGSNGRLEFNYPKIEIQDFFEVASRLYDASQDSTLTLAQKFNYLAVYRNMLDYWKDCGFPSEQFYGKHATDITEFRNLTAIYYPARNFLACRHIWFDWFRDQNLIGDDVRDTYCNKSFPADGILHQSFTNINEYGSFVGDVSHLLAPLPISCEKDYFTTRMAEPQRGNAAFVPVKLPSSDVNPGLISNASYPNLVGESQSLRKVGTVFPFADSSTGYEFNDRLNSNDIIGMFDYNLVRVAKGVQKYLEKNNVAGGADLQQLLAHWGVAPNPAVFQRSTYIGSFSSDISTPECIAPMENAQVNAGEVVQRCYSNGNGNFEYSAQESGLFIIVQFARPENYYLAGIRRENMHGLLGNGRFDFFTPELEKTGFQPMYAWEHTGAMLLASAAPWDTTTGFVPRYAECKRQFNEYRGQLSLPSHANLRVARSYEDAIADETDLFINSKWTMVYGYPATLQYDKFFAVVNPIADHFGGYIHFDGNIISTRNEYSAPLIEDSKGNDITLPYAGVRM